VAKKLSRIEQAIIQTAEDMHARGVIKPQTYEKITMRHLGARAKQAPPEMSPEDIRALRDRAHMSQAAFAQHLRMSTGYLSKLERGLARPHGTALTLLAAIQRIGIEVVL